MTAPVSRCENVSDDSHSTVTQGVKLITESTKRPYHRVGLKPTGRPGRGTTARREMTAREIVAKYDDPLLVLARIMVETDDVKIKTDAAKALAPYLHAARKAVELTAGGDGSGLSIQVVRIAPLSVAGAIPASDSPIAGEFVEVRPSAQVALPPAPPYPGSQDGREGGC